MHAASDSLHRYGRAQVIMPCGTGKTLVGVGVRAALAAGLVLVVVPTLALIRQTAQRWREACSDDPAVLFACSDQTVAADEDRAVVVPEEVAEEIRAPVTTDPSALAAILRTWSRPGAGRGVAFATYASVERALRAASEAGLHFDLVIADEAHHCAGAWASPQAVLARYGDDDWAPVRARLFLTATPRAGSVGDGSSHLISMDDTAAFGPVAYRLSMLAAIQAGLLSDYQIAVVGVGVREAQRLSAGRDLLGEQTADRVLSPGLMAATIALGRAMHRTRLRRIVTFHSRIRDARNYAKVVPALLAGNSSGGLRVSAAAAYADMPARERQAVIARFEQAGDHHAVIASNVRCLAEGIDLPSLDAVLFADPRHGLVDVMQAVGRVMRPYPGKAHGMVILPVLVPEVGQPTRKMADNDRFTNTLRILRVLRDHDTRLAAQLDELRTQTSQLKRLPAWLAGRHLPDGPLRFVVSDTRALATFSTFSLRIVAETTAPWHERYGSLERWAAERGHSRIPVSTIHDGARLGGWAHEQRALRARGLLAADRAAALEGLPGWTWSPHDAAWERGYEALAAYAREHGSTAVKQTYRTADFALGSWVKAQRELYSKGRLAEWRADRLAALPGWTWRVRPRTQR